MLNTFRKNTKIIIWSVIAVFILWGGFSVSTQFKSDGRYAGNAFGKNISYQEFEGFYKASQLFNFGGKTIKDEQALRQSAWQGVVLSREAKRQKIEVSDNEVRQQVLKLLEDQKVDPDNYEIWAERSLRETPKQFEEQIREMIRIQKLIIKLTPSGSSITATPEEAKKEFLDQSDQIAAEIIQFATKEEASMFWAKLKSPEDWKKQKEEKPNAFQQTELVSMDMFNTILQIPPDIREKIKKLGKDHFSEVLPLGKGYAVFYISNRIILNEKDFDTQKDKYIESAKDRKRQSILLQKTHEILNQAQLKDYLNTEGAPTAPNR